MHLRFLQSSKRVLVFFGLLGALFLTSCGPTAPPLPGEAKTQPAQEVVKQRAEARWERMLARDFPAVYAFETPAYRATVSLEQYQARFGGAVRWSRVGVDQVTIAPAGDRAEVVVTVDYETPAPLGGRTIYGSQSLLEHWILVQGGWWRVEDEDSPSEGAPTQSDPR